MTIPINREMRLKNTYEFGLDEGNRLGYVNVVFWVKRNQPADYDKNRLALMLRIADLVEQDPECQRILQAVSDSLAST